MSKFLHGQWVRLPKEFGYAEGQTVSTPGFLPHIFGDEPATGVYFPQNKSGIICLESWLTPIEEPSNYPEAPKWNPDSNGHPMVNRHTTEAELVTSYTRSIERGLTEIVCWCPWTALQVEGKMGRLRTGEHPQCPVHTKEGFLFGFIDYVREHFAKDAAAEAYVKVLIEGEGTGQVKGFLSPDAERVCPACNKPHDPPYRFACNDPNPDAGYGIPEYEGPEKPIETLETKQADVRFL